MVEVTCKFTNIKFEANTKRTQVHPNIATWKQSANRNGWYSRFFQTIEYGVANGFSTFEQFEEILAKAARNEPLEAPPEPDPKLKSAVVNALDGSWGLELERGKGSFCKRISSIDSRIDSGYSLIGETVSVDSTFEPGIYIDCATDSPSNTDIRKGRKPHSHYTLFRVHERGMIEILLRFTGRRLNEVGKILNDVWELAKANGVADVAEVETKAELEAQVTVESRKFLGRVGDTAKHEGDYYYILRSTSVRWSEDEDGITAPGNRTVGDLGAVIVDEWEVYTYHLRPATEEEVTQKLEQEQEQEQQKIRHQTAIAAVMRVKDIALEGEWTWVENPSVHGTKVSYRDKEASYDSPCLIYDEEEQKVWRVIYNGRDGDDWSSNNYGSCVAKYKTLTPGLLQELEDLAESIKAVFPNAVGII